MTVAQNAAQDAAGSAQAAANSADDARRVADSIPEDYTALASDVSSLKGDIVALYDQTDALFALCLDGTPATYASGQYLERIDEEQDDPISDEEIRFTTLVNVEDGSQIVLGGNWRTAED